MGQSTNIQIDREGYIFVDRVKVAQVITEGQFVILRFQDRCSHRSERRGTKYVDIPIQDIVTAIMGQKDQDKGG